METLAADNREKLIELLSERFTFECTVRRLYERILQRVEASGDTQTRTLEPTLRHIRDQEREHHEWLEGEIEKLGGTVFRQTERGYLINREASGIEEIILHTEVDIPRLFHALLAAEMVDHAGWELLVALANEAGDYRARNDFLARMREEEEHVRFVRAVLSRFTLEEVLPGHA